MTNERILAVGSIVAGGDVQWRLSPLVTVPSAALPSDDRLTEAELAEMWAYEAEKDKQQCRQASLDAAHACLLAEEWQDYFLEQEWLDHQL